MANILAKRAASLLLKLICVVSILIHILSFIDSSIVVSKEKINGSVIVGYDENETFLESGTDPYFPVCTLNFINLTEGKDSGEEGNSNNEEWNERELDNATVGYRLCYVLGTGMLGALIAIVMCQYMPYFSCGPLYRQNLSDDWGIAYGVEYLESVSEFSADEESDPELEHRFQMLEAARQR